MPRVLVFRHVLWEHLGYIADSLADEHIGFTYVDLAADPGQELPFPVRYADGVISMGGPMSANDPDPYIARERRYLEEAIARSIPILGVCLGAQMLASSLGSRVFRNAVKEIGWFPVEFRPESENDALFHGLSGPEVVFHWHGETFDLPSGAHWLASSSACAHQAFRVGSNHYGLQFHLETSSEMIDGWLKEDLMCGDLREVNSPIDPYRHATRQQELARLVFGRWARLVGRHP